MGQFEIAIVVGSLRPRVFQSKPRSVPSTSSDIVRPLTCGLAL
jgi:hypothetical protein